MRARLTAVAFLATSLVAAGCGGGTKAANDPDASTAPNLDALKVLSDKPSGGMDKITWDLPYGEPASIDPIKSFNYPENTVVSNLCEGLMRIEPDFTVSPALAEKVTQPDESTYVYTLRKGVKFWNGDPVTTKDVVFSLKRNLDPKEGSYWAGAVTQNIASVVATGPHEVTIKLKKPDLTFNGYMATPIANVVQQSFRKKVGTAFGTPEGGVMCTGPYKVGKWAKGQKISLVRNDSYWNTTKKAKTREIDLQFIVDAGALSSALKTGAVQGAYDIPLSAVKTLQSSSKGRLILGKSLQIVAVISTGEGPLADSKIRRALAMATDRQAIAKVVYAGTATAAKSIVPPDGWSYGDGAFSKAMDALPGTDVDLEGARKLVAEAGAPTEPITIAYPAERQYYADILSEMANAGRKLDITIKPKGVPSAQYGAFFSDPKARKGYGGFMTTNYMDIPDPLAFLRTMGVPGGSQNYNGYDDSKVTNWLAKAQATADEGKRAELVAKAMTEFESTMPWIPVVAPAVRLYMDDKITGAPASFVYLYYPWAADLGAS